MDVFCKQEVTISLTAEMEASNGMGTSGQQEGVEDVARTLASARYLIRWTHVDGQPALLACSNWRICGIDCQPRQLARYQARCGSYTCFTLRSSGPWSLAHDRRGRSMSAALAR